MNKLEKQPPAWHAQVIAEITKEFAETNELSETARRRRARLGLMLIWVKETGKADGSIPHGKFRPWMKQHLPAIPWPTLCDYMGEIRSLCDLLRWQMSEIPTFEIPAHVLLLQKPDGLARVHKERQKKLLNVIDQRSHFRAMTKYGQVEIKDDMTVPKVGRRKGEGGATREQRLAAKLAVAEASLKGLKSFILDFGNSADQLADDLHIGNPEAGEEFREVFPKVENLFRYMQRVQQGRKP